MGKKRVRNANDDRSERGDRKPAKRPREAVEGAPPPVPSSKNSTIQSTEETRPVSLRQKGNSDEKKTEQPLPAKPQGQSKQERPQKRPRLPDNVSISKRPIPHPAIPTPFASSASPKVVYITQSSPFIPAIKRVRKLLTEISKRHQQSLSSQRTRQKRSKPLEANGRLKAAHVETEIVEASQQKGGGGIAQEKVYVKATGRAIERALQMGVHFQGEDDCVVKVEMGSVRAIDDIEIKNESHGGGEGGEKGLAEREGTSAGRKGKNQKWKDEEIPETRIRTLSSITVIIGLKN